MAAQPGELGTPLQRCRGGEEVWVEVTWEGAGRAGPRTELRPGALRGGPTTGCPEMARGAALSGAGRGAQLFSRQSQVGHVGA